MENTEVQTRRPSPYLYWVISIVVSFLLLGLVNQYLFTALISLFKLDQMTQVTQLVNTLFAFLYALITAGIVAVGMWLPVRKYLSHSALWLWGSFAGWLIANFGNSSPTIASPWQQMNPNSQVGSMVWVVLGFVGSFVTIAVTQWLTMRLDYKKAWRWLIWSTLAALVGAGATIGTSYLVNQVNSEIVVALAPLGAFGIIFSLISGIGLHQGLRESELIDAQDVEESHNKSFLVIWVLAALAGYIAMSLVTRSQIVESLAAPLLQGDQKTALLIDAVLVGLLLGLLFGAFQFLALRRRVYNRAGLWLAATPIGMALGYLLSTQALGIAQNLQNTITNQIWVLLIYRLLLEGSRFLLVGLLQAPLVRLWSSSNAAWSWPLVTLAAQWAGTLVSFFVSPALGMAVTALITGYAFSNFTHPSVEAEISYKPALPEGEAPADLAERLAEAQQVLNDRLAEEPAVGGFVSVAEDGLMVSLYDENQADEALKRISPLGALRVFAASPAPAAGAAIPANAVDVLTDQELGGAAVTSDGVLELRLLETESDRLTHAPAEPWFAALDGAVIGIVAPAGEKLTLTLFDAEQADTVAVILNNDRLPFALKAVVVDGE